MRRHCSKGSGDSLKTLILASTELGSRIGTSGGTLSMWLAGKAWPRAEEFAAIEKFLKG